MYKRASRSLQHANRVGDIDPAKGYVAGSSDSDLIINANNLGEQECVAELDQLQNEMIRAQQALAVARRENDLDQAKFLGMRYLTICSRRGPLKERLKFLRHQKSQENQHQCLGNAVKSVLAGTPYLEKVWAEKDRLLAEMDSS